MSWQSSAAAITPLVLGGVGFVVGYQRSRKVDEVAEHSGVINDSRADETAAFDRLSKFADIQAADNTTLRDDIRLCRARNETITNERDALRVELARMHRRYGNGTPPGGTPATTT